ncbi:putative minor capsid protein [Indivirus ILV1]|uniref:Putative minor capsid protein n=1 Tax=Indivirus ILV1 TaxID=1977633 RepID=A0A1V0SCS6_9VIRU|nr:putative minor capsid protein [Indivirus ILV1]
MSDIQKKLLKENNKSLVPGKRYFEQPQSYNLFQQNTCITDAGQAVHTQDIYMRNDKDNYDPYYGYLYDRGLLLDGHQRRRFSSKFISIDSRQRKKINKIVTKTPIILEKDPLIFDKKFPRVMKIKQNNHNFSTGDTIQITNAHSKESLLKSTTSSGPAFIIYENTNIMQIFYKHSISLDRIDHKSQIINVSLEGIKGDQNNPNFIGSIPINLINGVHTVHICINNYQSSSEYFFIILPINLTKKYTLSTFNFKLSILAIAGIPLEIINNSSKYFIITDVSDDTYSIELPFDLDSSDEITVGGGMDVNVSKVISVDHGYPFPNNYKISLGKVYENITLVKMVSSEIPYTGKIINQTNNKLYWNNLNDGDTLYSITVPFGNYTFEELEVKINELMKDIKIIINTSTSEVIFESQHFFRLRFDMQYTLGNILGFRESGCKTSITSYAQKHSNQDYYEYQIKLEKLGVILENPENQKNSQALQLISNSYIIMVINEIKTLCTLGKIKDAFAKILLCGKPGKILFNTFVDTYHNFNDPLNELSELTISFYNPDGTLYDFNGADHSFTLELITVYDIPEGTGLSTKTGKNYNLEIG